MNEYFFRAEVTIEAENEEDAWEQLASEECIDWIMDDMIEGEE